MKPEAFTRLMPVTASVLIHVGIVATVAAVPGWAPVREAVLIAELVEPAVPVPPPIRAPEPLRAPAPRPVRPPRPITMPLPLLRQPLAAPEPEPPAPVVPDPPPIAATEPPAPSSPAPTVEPHQAANRLLPEQSADTGSAAFAAGPPPATGRTEAAPAPPARPPSSAAIPSDGVTQRAIPRGGYQYLPSYPSRARRLGIQGTTLLQVLITDDGRVGEVLVKQSAGHPDLDQAAVDAVRRWRFEPARRGTEPVAMWVQLPFEFRFR